jgi:hypothetical protein
MNNTFISNMADLMKKATIVTIKELVAAGMDLFDILDDAGQTMAATTFCNGWLGSQV